MYAKTTHFCRVNFYIKQNSASAGTAKPFFKTPLCASFKLSRQMQRGKTTHNFTVTFLQYTAEKCLPDFSQSAMHVAVVLPRAMHKSKSTKFTQKKTAELPSFQLLNYLLSSSTTVKVTAVDAELRFVTGLNFTTLTVPVPKENTYSPKTSGTDQPVAVEDKL